MSKDDDKMIDNICDNLTDVGASLALIAEEVQDVADYIAVNYETILSEYECSSEDMWEFMQKCGKLRAASAALEDMYNEVMDYWDFIMTGNIK